MIMIVDDNARMRGMVKQYMQNISVGSEFCECSDGLEAVSAYQRLRPTWVLMDIKMPRMDGFAATKTIRSQFPGARIIILTNFDDPDLREAARKSGAEGYVLKERLFELRKLMIESPDDDDPASPQKGK